jgi:hypothetical protein
MTGAAEVGSHSCGTSPIRLRRRKRDIEAVCAAIKDVLHADHPQTVRQVFYQLVVRGVVEKTHVEYKATVCRLLADMRLADDVPWDWIIDETRQGTVTRTFNNVEDCLRETARGYRRSALNNSDVYIEIWSEKQALAGIIWEAASEYDVPVMVSKGMPSLTQVYGSAGSIIRAAKAGKQSYIYQFGDHDPTGCLIIKIIEKHLRYFCNKYNCHLLPIIERIALTPEQVTRFRLPTHFTKREGNHHARKFEGDSVELDALPSRILRQLVTDCIERHITPQQLSVLRAAEESETELIEQLADMAAEQDG